MVGYSTCCEMYSSSCSLCLVTSAQTCTGIEPKVVESVCCLLELEFDQYSPFLAAVLICGSCQAFLAQAHQMLETLNNLKKQLLSYCKKLAQMFINMPEPEVGGQGEGRQVDEKPIRESTIPVIIMSDFGPAQDELVDQVEEVRDQSTTTTVLNPTQLVVDTFCSAPVLNPPTGTILTILDLKEETVTVHELNEMQNLSVNESTNRVVTNPSAAHNFGWTKNPKQTRDPVALKLRPCDVRLTDYRVPMVGTNKAITGSESVTQEQDLNMASFGKRFVEVEHIEPSMETSSREQSVLLNIVPILCTGEKNGPSESVPLDIDDSSRDNRDSSTITSGSEANVIGFSPCLFEVESVTNSNYRRSSRIKLKRKMSNRIEETASEGTGSDFEPNNEADESSDSDCDFQLKSRPRIPYKPNRSSIPRSGNEPPTYFMNKSIPDSENVLDKVSRRSAVEQLDGAIKLRKSYVKFLTCKIKPCTYAAGSLASLERHVFEHKFASNDNIFPCPLCGLRFSVQEQLDSHLTRIHFPFTGKEPYKCPACPRALTSMFNLQIHYNGTHSPIDPETKSRESVPGAFCTVKGCSYRALGQRTLQVHIRKVHEKDPKPNRCELCPKAYARRNELVVHISATHGGHKVVCHLCGRGFAGNGNLHSHMRQKHRDEGDKFSCSVCGKVFYYEKGCKAHEEKHKPGSFLCLIQSCPRFKEEFGSLERLKAHVQEVHESAPPRNRKHVCDVCGLSCSDYQAFYKHKRTQHGNQPVSCTSCHKSFKSVTYLRNHEKVKHPKADGKVWPCKLCPKAFYCQVYLYRHLNWHKTGKPAWQSFNSHHTGEVPYKQNEEAGAFELQALLSSRPQGRTDQGKVRGNPARKRKRTAPETADESEAGSPEKEATATGAEHSSVQEP